MKLTCESRVTEHARLFDNVIPRPRYADVGQVIE